MRLLTVPNWSFARNRALTRAFRDILDDADVTVHFCKGDVDHNRTVTAFSGETEELRNVLLALCAIAFDAIDLNRHVGVHPRIGALDVCPFVPYESSDLAEAIPFAESIAEEIAAGWGVPVYLYERSERGRHEADLPSLRRGGFGSLQLRELHPDFGPASAHRFLGVTVLGVRDFLIAFNVNLESEDLQIAKRIAKSIRDLRTEGDSRFLGVRALGLPLASREMAQVSLNMTLPDLTSPDAIIDWIRSESRKYGVKIASSELIGVIRQRDMEKATDLPVQRSQIVAI